MVPILVVGENVVAGLPEGTTLPVALAIAFAEVNALLPVAATPSEDAAGKLLTS